MTKNPTFNEEVRSRFLNSYQHAAAGKLEDWKASLLSCLALIILLDQFPRNLFRGQPQAFATEPPALDTAQYAISQGFDQDMSPVQCWFVYMPFEHSEDLAIQRQSIKLFSTLKDNPNCASGIDFAYRHLSIIERFGRFPDRNETLSRKITPDEAEFLNQPDSSF